MWQRIQTLYLLIASGLLVAMYFQPYGTGFIILFSIALAAQLLAIVALKSRTLQMRLSNLAALLLLGLQIWMAVSYGRSQAVPQLYGSLSHSRRNSRFPGCQSHTQRRTPGAQRIPPACLQTQIIALNHENT